MSDCNNEYKTKMKLRKVGVFLLFMPFIVAGIMFAIAGIMIVCNIPPEKNAFISLLLDCSFVAFVFGIIFIVKSNKKYKDAKTISRYVIHSYGCVNTEIGYEEIAITVKEDGYYFCVSIIYDKFNSGGDCEKVPDEFITNWDLDVDSLLKYIGDKYPYISSLKEK